MLRHNFRAGSSTLIGRESSSDTRPAQASSGSSRYGPSDPHPNARDATRDNTRDNRSSTVRFDPKDTKGIQLTMTSLAHISCDCNAQDIDTTYRMCCATVGNSPSYSAATLFDTGAHTSFVNREVAAWIVQQSKIGDGVTQGKRKAPAMLAISVSLAGTALSSPILGSVYFDITFFNEVTQLHETLNNIHAQVIDSCIAVIICRPMIRENHLVQKFPVYFDETNQGEPSSEASDNRNNENKLRRCTAL